MPNVMALQMPNIPESTILFPDVQLVRNQMEKIYQLYQVIMIYGIDYGDPYPNAAKPTLLKPGAEKIVLALNLVCLADVVEKIEDWNGKEFGHPFFFYHVVSTLQTKAGLILARAPGIASSHETQYRYRIANRACPDCHQETLMRSRYDEPGWYCNVKRGGCGSLFVDNSQAASAIEAQKVGRAENLDVADQAHTIMAKAVKRSQVAVVRWGTAASSIFDQPENPDADAEPAAAPIATLDRQRSLVEQLKDIKPASVAGFKGWQEFQTRLSERHRELQNERGKANPLLITRLARALGFSEITEENAVAFASAIDAHFVQPTPLQESAAPTGES